MCGGPCRSWSSCSGGDRSRAGDELFQQKVLPILGRRCLSCHNDTLHRGDLSLRTRDDVFDLGYVIGGDPDGSYLLDLITARDGKAQMPKGSDPLTSDELQVIRDWIESGATWPEAITVTPPRITDTDWWSLRPLVRPEVPDAVPLVRQTSGTAVADPRAVRNPIDAFLRTGCRKPVCRLAGRRLGRH